MECPYCREEMESGHLRSAADRAVYWFPKDANLDFLFLNRKDIESREGVVLDQLDNSLLLSRAFVAKERPVSHYCRACRVFLTKL